MSIRKKQAKLVIKHLKDLEKRGIDVSRVTQGKTIEKLAYSKKSYSDFMNRKKSVLSQERDIKKRTNDHGYTFSQREYKEIKKLEDKMRRKKQAEFWKLEKEVGSLSKVEKAFLSGDPIRHKNSKENVELQTSFRRENYFNSFGRGFDFKAFKEAIEDDIKDFSYKDVVEDKRALFKAEMEKWANAGVFGVSPNKSFKKKRVNELMEYYDNMSFIQKVQFNQDMSHKLQYVESASDNIFSKWDERRLLIDLMEQQETRDFIIST